MGRSKQYLSTFLFALPLLSCCHVHGQTVFSYIDESGVRVFTNIPPKTPLGGMSITGAASLQQDRKDAIHPESPYDAIIGKHARQYQLDPSLIRSMIATESGFNYKAVSAKGAHGLMQLMPATASSVGVSNLFDPEQNILGGVRHMRKLLDMFDNDLVLSLAAYNAGENLVQQIRRIPNIRETHDYVLKVTNLYGKNQMTLQTRNDDSQSVMFRFTDHKGILHLTNIPPIRRSSTGASIAQDP